MELPAPSNEHVSGIGLCDLSASLSDRDQFLSHAMQSGSDSAGRRRCLSVPDKRDNGPERTLPALKAARPPPPASIAGTQEQEWRRLLWIRLSPPQPPAACLDQEPRLSQAATPIGCT